MNRLTYINNMMQIDTGEIIQHYVHEKFVAITDLFRNYNQDSTMNGLDSIVHFSQNDTTKFSKFILFKASIENEEYQVAKTILNNITSSDDEILFMKDYNKWMIPFLADSIEFIDMDSGEEEILRHIAESNTKYSVNAKVILNIAFNEPIKLDYHERGLNKKNTFPEANNKNLTRVNIFPNPATNILNINYSLSSELKNPIIEIYDINGRVVFNKKLPTVDNNLTISMDNYSSGLYLIIIKDEKRIIESKKIIKQ